MGGRLGILNHFKAAESVKKRFLSEWIISEDLKNQTISIENILKKQKDLLKKFDMFPKYLTAYDNSNKNLNEIDT